MKANLENTMAVKAGNRAVHSYPVDQVFQGLVVLQVIWCLIALMMGSLFR